MDVSTFKYLSVFRIRKQKLGKILGPTEEEPFLYIISTSDFSHLGENFSLHFFA